jgi:hypothetical protein
MATLGELGKFNETIGSGLLIRRWGLMASMLMHEITKVFALYNLGRSEEASTHC